ncbi:hypothetical protein VL20_1711 [Microcystis panniformis FACHB-1757]|uniref:Uncharacterized protein n=1 Tax=Microcystis panniformis FACHB-1757 TaxID=1638788 RepID=A0A0K1RYS7_9CHRO|nr:hypothetical protein VL20_1711 [Microcystis panniformis FACHB-1757]
MGLGVGRQYSPSQEIIFIYSPLSPLYNNYSQPEIRWVPIILCAFCQKNFFFAIKLHKKKIIVVGEID